MRIDHEDLRYRRYDRPLHGKKDSSVVSPLVDSDGSVADANGNAAIGVSTTVPAPIYGQVPDCSAAVSTRSMATT